ncbi:lipocalin family protein [Chryseobacterium sp. JV274]|uniref:lipocalin family protein n=1 Tax=Chryseobacterium sp. JV274 TaxID=1932669 RepID=UPI0009869E60|nr:lipocalin family protein [Chryseobacterium sp. JV274]CAD0218797.1 Lipocalin-like domain-containing protein [Chryseobacterium sp. JV274]
MFNLKPILFYFLLLFTASCSSNKLSGSWEFIDIYDGEIRQTDTLKTKTNNSRYGTGILTFYRDKTFSSIGNNGTYQIENNLLKMKYHGDEKVTSMRISNISKDYLLLFSMAGSPKTWFYKKVRGKEK